MNQDQIDVILSMDNLILRNLNVTLGYHEMSEDLKSITGSKNVGWCGFGTYASKTAGYSIRQEILPEDLDRAFRSFRMYRRLLHGLRRYLTNAAEGDRDLALIGQIMARISLRVSDGNIKVFAELAPAFIQLIDVLANTETYDEAKLNRVLTRFQAGSSDAGGQDALKQAFKAYYEAKFESDPKRKAELVYLGNLLVGWHEQTQLQPDIENAINAPVDEVIGEPLPLYITPLGKRINQLVHKVFLSVSRRVFSNIATQLFMSIYLPSGELQLGSDVKSPHPEQDYPPDLHEIQLAQVNELLDELDRTRNTLSGSGARNWANLYDRMNYILDFFRSYQQDQRLFEPPFSPEQTEALKNGRLPLGKL